MIKHILHCACQAVAIQARCHSHIAQNVTDAVEVENDRLLSEVDEVTRARLVDIENTEVYEVVTGSTIFGVDWDLCTVDGCHPNDLGHYRMAMGILPILEKLL